MPSNGGSLANMWGRASAKPMPPSTTNSTAVASVAATADAQICAKEEADGNSSDDEHGINYKRGSTNANNRKRTVVFDYSDDEEDDNIVSIASPELPKQHTPDLVVGIVTISVTKSPMIEVVSLLFVIYHYATVEEIGSIPFSEPLTHIIIAFKCVYKL
ncbi:hypothetical protein Zm00014a_010950 [Zea mays]|nr:DNA-directed DNA polymerases [Zea mays]PWZ11318.1 hypothetical protein Zm00014a_034701 [Zea mays]PWZ28972.1 hypothetical protein Zm00014a_029932 [Zea mays]PWZ40509.1 hypothetical protein Zm00014a_010950 [Zea mays]